MKIVTAINKEVCPIKEAKVVLIQIWITTHVVLLLAHLGQKTNQQLNHSNQRKNMTLWKLIKYYLLKGKHSKESAIWKIPNRQQILSSSNNLPCSNNKWIKSSGYLNLKENLVLMRERCWERPIIRSWWPILSLRVWKSF